MGEEKRQYFRWRKKIRITCSLTGKDDSYEEIFTEDLSETGLQILLSERLALRQTIRLRLEFVYDSVPIMAAGRVVYVKAHENRYRIGLEFMEMDDFQKQRLKRGLEKARQDFEAEAKQGYA